MAFSTIFLNPKFCRLISSVPPSRTKFNTSTTLGDPNKLRNFSVFFNDLLKNTVQSCHKNNTTSMIERFFSQHKNYCTKSHDSTLKGRHGYHEDTERVINEQILMELNASFAYLSMACFFGRTELALPGCQGYFMHMHQEEHEHATIFINYQLMRGGHVTLMPISVPKEHNWKSIVNAFENALKMEKEIKEKFVQLYDVAEAHKDLQVMDLVSTEFMAEQNNSICEIARLLTRAKMTEDCVGEYLFDKLLFKSFVAKSPKNLMYKLGLKDWKDNDVYK